MKNVTKDLIKSGDYDITYQDLGTFVLLALFLTALGLLKWCFNWLLKK